MPAVKLEPIGTVESPLIPRWHRSKAMRGHRRRLVFEATVVEGLEGIRVGDDVIVLTWLDRAHRDVLRVASARR
jgi:tRNA (Thr-GGU) A37 N-methylase